MPRSEAVFTGWMYKAANKRQWKWNERFMVYMSDGEVLYYDTDNGGMPLGSLHLEDALEIKKVGP